MIKSNLGAISSLIFTPAQAAEALGVKEASAKVTLHRYAKKAFVVRLKRGEYALKSRWDHLGENETYQIANRLQVPSYVSLTTALSHYGLTTQVQQDFIESIALVRTRSIGVLQRTFRYIKIDKKLFVGFDRENGVFIARPEKALLDSLYLATLGRYRLDFSAIEFGKINRKELRRQLRIFPASVGRLWRDRCTP